MNKLILILLIPLLFAGCVNLRPNAIEDAEKGIPEEFSMYSQGEAQMERWWDNFGSLELNNLVDAAVNENFSIKEAWARLKQAQLAARKEGAMHSPTLDYAADSSHREQKISGKPRTNSGEWGLGLTASYELDLWGKIEADKTYLSLNAKASKEDLKTAVSTVTGEIAENWIARISAINQRELYIKQRDLQIKLLELIKYRFPAGKSSALDIYQQQQAIERIKASLIPLESRIKLLGRKLAFLMGKGSFDELQLEQMVFPAKKEVPALGLPADLLAARPDVRAAGLRLNAAQWKISSAKADRLPALRLSASHKYSSSDLSSIFDNWLANLAANLTGPIFDGGRRELEVQRTKAVVDERLATYRKVVFNAVKEVEDAIADEQQYVLTLASLENQLLLSSKTMREAITRYINGNSDFVNVLREQLNNLVLQRDIIIAKEKMLIARIKLHKALGGSWINIEREANAKQ